MINVYSSVPMKQFISKDCSIDINKFVLKLKKPDYSRKIPKQLKIYKGINKKGEHFWYTKQFCLQYRYGLDKIFRNRWKKKANLRKRWEWEKYEYEGNEFYFDNKDRRDLCKFISSLLVLIQQLSNLKEHNFVIIVKVGDVEDNERLYENGAIWIYFFEKRDDNFTMKMYDDDTWMEIDITNRYTQ